MTIRIRRFEWDEWNRGHLELAHPHVALEDMEKAVRLAKRYFRIGEDLYGKAVYTARCGNMVVYFNIKAGGVVRIFSVREAK